MNVAWYVVGQVIECERDTKTEALIRMGVIEQVKEESKPTDLHQYEPAEKPLGIVSER